MCVCVCVYCFAVFCAVCSVFPSVLWYCWLGLLACKTVSQITCTVLLETLNPAQSINLHSLPIRQRVTAKIALLVWKCVHGATPAYLQELCVLVEDVRGRPRLRSASILDVGLFSYRVWRHQRDSEVLRSIGRQFGTVCCQLCGTAVCLWERSIDG